MSLEALLDAEFRSDPWAHQIREFEEHCDDPARALLWQMRTGKSRSTIDKASHLYRRREIDALLIFAPNGVHANWVERELPRHLWHSVPARMMAWRTRVAGKRASSRLGKAALAAWEEAHGAFWDGYRQALQSPDLMVASFNAESLARDDVRSAIKRIVKKRKVFAVWDESTDYRTPGSKRTMQMRALGRAVPYRGILDGTSATNSPLHLYSQFNLLKDGALGYTEYEKFESRYAEFESARGRGGGSYRKLKEYRNLEELRASVAQWSSVVLRDDCQDLPDLQRRVRHVPFSPEQERVYRQVESEIKIEIDRGKVADIGAKTIRLNKLQQVLGGFLTDRDGRRHRIPGVNNKLEAVSEEVYLAGGRCIIWCQFQEELDMVAARLRADGRTVWEYHGRVSDEEKSRIRREFADAPPDTDIVGQPQSGARGIEVPADSIIWFSHTFSAILREQANERATVMGGRNVNLVDLVGPGVDSYIVDTVSGKIDIADHVAGRGLQEILNQYGANK